MKSDRIIISAAFISLWNKGVQCFWDGSLYKKELMGTMVSPTISSTRGSLSSHMIFNASSTDYTGISISSFQIGFCPPLSHTSVLYCFPLYLMIIKGSIYPKSSVFLNSRPLTIFKLSIPIQSSAWELFFFSFIFASSSTAGTLSSSLSYPWVKLLPLWLRIMSNSSFDRKFSFIGSKFYLLAFLMELV